MKDIAKGFLSAVFGGALCVTAHCDEVRIRGPKLENIPHEVWSTKAAVDYQGVYELRESDGPQDLVVVSYFEDKDRKGYVSILKVKKDFIYSQPEYQLYGVFEVDREKGLFEAEYTTHDVRAVRFRMPSGGASVLGLSVDGVLFKKR
ncbi:MAG: hypothetical protein MUF31_03380 [Akkermansiaceae bacterium]|jgi:hypothetical protein|nr:hypothetical protein [Akkermansiaceae bacterium]